MILVNRCIWRRGVFGCFCFFFLWRLCCQQFRVLQQDQGMLALFSLSNLFLKFRKSFHCWFLVLRFKPPSTLSPLSSTYHNFRLKPFTNGCEIGGMMPPLYWSCCCCCFGRSILKCSWIWIACAFAEMALIVQRWGWLVAAPVLPCPAALSLQWEA